MEQERETQLISTRSEDSILAPSEEKVLSSDERELTASPTEHDITMHASTEQLLDEAGSSEDEEAPVRKGEEEMMPLPKQLVPTTPAPSPATAKPSPPFPPHNNQQVPLVGQPPSEGPHSHPSTTTAVHSSTLQFPLSKRPLSTAAGSSTEGDLIYDRLPVTLQRPAKLTTGSEKPILPVTTPPKPDTGTQIHDLESQKQGKKEVVSKQKPPSGSYPNNHMILTIVSMILCGVFLNIFAFICLIPAFIFAKKSTRSAERGSTGEAEEYAKKTLILNLVAVAVTFAAVVIILVVTQIVFGAVVY